MTTPSLNETPLILGQEPRLLSHGPTRQFLRGDASSTAKTTATSVVPTGTLFLTRGGIWTNVNYLSWYMTCIISEASYTLGSRTNPNWAPASRRPGETDPAGFWDNDEGEPNSGEDFGL